MFNSNPMQVRMDSLLQQKQMIEQQLQNLQQMQNVPPININNNMPGSMATSFDFNGKWVQSEQEAKSVMVNNLPLILFDKNTPSFYMKNLDGSFKKFKFEEVIEQPVNATDTKTDDKLNALEAKLNALIDALSSTDTNTKGKAEKAVESTKKAK